MKNLIIFCILFLLISCTKTKEDQKLKLTIAIGHMDELERAKTLSTDLDKVLPKEYKINYLYLTYRDIDFKEKNVIWDLGIGRTDFALKELGEGIRFFPFAWEKYCFTGVEKAWTNLKKEKDFNILFVHPGYISTNSIRVAYDHYPRANLFSTSKNDEIEKIVRKFKINLVLNDIILIQRATGIEKFSKLKDLNIFKDRHLDSLKIPCRTYFFNTDIDLSLKSKIESTLLGKSWIYNGNTHYSSIEKTKDDEFEQIAKKFNWKLDSSTREKITEVFF